MTKEQLLSLKPGDKCKLTWTSNTGKSDPQYGHVIVEITYNTGTNLSIKSLSNTEGNSWNPGFATTTSYETATSILCLELMLESLPIHIQSKPRLDCIDE